MTQERLAEGAEVSVSSVSTWEDERGALSARTDLAAVAIAGRLARTLGVDPLSIAECRRCLLPETTDLVPPRTGWRDRRDALVPFVRWLRLALARRCWKPEDLAHRIDVSPPTVVSWGTGREFPRDAPLARLVKVMEEPGLREQTADWQTAWRGTLTSRGKPWAPEEDAIVLGHPHLSAAEVGALVGRTAAAVEGRRRARKDRDRSNG